MAGLAAAVRLSPGSPGRSLRTLVAALGAAALALGVGLGLSLSGGSGTPRLTAAFQDPAAGIYGHRPAAWTVSDRGGGIALLDPNRAALVEVAAIGPAAHAGRLLASSIAVIRNDYTGVQVQSRTSGRIDRLPAEAVALLARNRAGVSLHVVLTTAPGKKVAYLLELFVTATAPAATVTAARAVINSLQLGM